MENKCVLNIDVSGNSQEIANLGSWEEKQADYQIKKIITVEEGITYLNYELVIKENDIGEIVEGMSKQFPDLYIEYEYESPSFGGSGYMLNGEEV